MTVCLSTNGLNVHRADAPPRTLLVATAAGLARLERDGSFANPWQLTELTLRELHPSALVFDSSSGNLFAGIHNGGLYFSGDDARTWERRTNGLTVEHVFSLRMLRTSDATTLFAGTEPVSLFTSQDDGQTWTELAAIHSVPNMDRWTFPGPPHIAHTKSIAIDPRDPAVMYVGVEQGALLTTRDSGASWHEIDAYYTPDDMWYRDIHQVVLRPNHPDEIFMNTGIGFYHSPDGGRTWQHRTGPDSRIGYPDQLVFSPLDDSVVFMTGARRDPTTWRASHSADATVLKSTDAGETWHEASAGLPSPMHHNIEAMSVVGYPGGFALFIGDTGGNIYASDDAAASWSHIAGGLAPVSKGGHFRALQTTAA